MAQDVRRNVAQSCGPGVRLQYEPESLSSQPLPPVVEEEGFGSPFPATWVGGVGGCPRQDGPPLLQVVLQRFQGWLRVYHNLSRLATPSRRYGPAGQVQVSDVQGYQLPDPH